MTTNTYLGISRPFNNLGNNTVTAASSSTATAEIELRIMVVTTVGAHNMTKQEAIMALETLRRYIMNADFVLGEGGSGGNIPLPIGAPTAGA